MNDKHVNIRLGSNNPFGERYQNPVRKSQRVRC
jgi:hypothetical protein